MPAHYKRKKLDGWYVAKAYPHFDQPLSFKQASSYVKDPANVARHGFLPFLSFDQVSRRYRTEVVHKVLADGTKKRERVRLSTSPKIRPLRITSHVDGYIFAYYTKILSEKYEALINASGVSKHVIAYRKALGTNIDFAKAAFDEIERRKSCVAIAFDVEKFFDTIDHRGLKAQWERLLAASKLPADHHKVFRAITRYSKADRDKSCARLNVDERKLAPGEPICTSRQFREVIKRKGDSLVQVNSESFGIPQGSPISAVLANIFMLPFDERMHAISTDRNWFFLRYCDDILVVGPPSDEADIRAVVGGEIEKLGANVKLNGDKTEVSFFEEHGAEIFVAPKHPGEAPLPLQYLGFTFDGRNVRIRSGSLARYWRKLLRSAKAAKYRARKRGVSIGGGPILKRRVYEQVTHLGESNFFTYAKRARKKFGPARMGRPLRKHFDRLTEELRTSIPLVSIKP